MPALIVLLIIILLLIGIFVYVKIKLSQLFETLVGTRDILEGIKLIKSQKEELETEPKTPYGMDSLLLPQIEKDFPNMNVEEMKKLAEDKVVDFLHSQKDRICSDINIHKTVINQYSKDSSICKLVFQTAVGFNEMFQNASHLKEVRMNTEFIYIYDNSKLKNGEAISLNCPNCGAPIKGLGHKTCPYCHTGLIDLATKTWTFKKVSIL